MTTNRVTVQHVDYKRKGKTVNSLNIKCKVKLNKESKSSENIEAIILAFIPSSQPNNTRDFAGSSSLDTCSTDAIVCLLTFDIGRLYQLSIHQIRIDSSEYDGAYQYFKKQNEVERIENE